MSKIIYILIANNTSETPVAEISLATGNHSMMALKLSQKLKHDTDTTKSYAYEDRYMFHFHNQKGVTVICMCDTDYPNRFAYQFLFEVREKIIESCGDSFSQVIGFGLKKNLVDEIKKIMIKYNSSADNNKIVLANKNVNEVKEIMIQNIDKVIARGEKIDLLVSKMDEMQENAAMFNKSAKENYCSICWRHYRIAIITVLVVFAAIFAGITIYCNGFDYKECLLD